LTPVAPLCYTLLWQPLQNQSITFLNHVSIVDRDCCSGAAPNIYDHCCRSPIGITETKATLDEHNHTGQRLEGVITYARRPHTYQTCYAGGPTNEVHVSNCECAYSPTQNRGFADEQARHFVVLKHDFSVFLSQGLGVKYRFGHQHRVLFQVEREQFYCLIPQALHDVPVRDCHTHTHTQTTVSHEDN
jgi:hypothetical protein